jgi:plastocyanin
MALNFPNNPALNDVYTVDQKTWRYTGTAWNVISGNVNAAVTSSFTNIAVAGQTTVAADTATDTLTLVAGSGIAITTNAATDTVTLTSVASTGNITIADTTLSVSNANPITITPNLVLGGTLRFPDNTVQTTATLQGPAGAPGASGTGSGNVNSVLGSYVDNALVRYSGTSGTTIKVSAASINDSGLLTAVNFSGGGGNITSLNADNLTTGTVADARFPATLPVASGTNLTALNATNLGSGTIPVLRLGTAGTRDATTYLRGDNTWATVSGGAAASDSFATIAVAGQSNVVADSASDTLTLVAGSNVTITTNATTDTITISSVGAGGGGATALIDLSDISTAGLTVDKIYLQAITRLVVTPNGSSSYRFDQYGASDNPNIYAISGTTIAFDISAVTASHPFLIQTSGGTNYDTGLVHVSTTGVISTASAAQGKTSGTLYWKIPVDTTGNYRYRCSVHGGMVGAITIKDITGRSPGSGYFLYS